jgi:ribonuclease/clavin/mitogillin
MSSIIDAVSIVLTCGDEIFAIQRQNFLKAFPGYWAFPGGKVEAGDEKLAGNNDLSKNLDQRLWGALVREAEEELGVNFNEVAAAGGIDKINFLGLAVTPDFNPFRFATYFFKIQLKAKLNFVIDRNEARIAKWMSAEELLHQYDKGFILAVPPVIKVIETFGKDPHTESIPDLNFQYDNEKFVPYIESLKSVRQIMPLSHTLPPAVRTNAFLIGDGKNPKILIDPSPQDDLEYDKFLRTIKIFGVDQILITHHHPDHYERSNKLALELNVPILLSSFTFDKILSKNPAYFNGIETSFLREGDVITQWLGRDVKIIEVPGHDEGQLAVAPEDMSWFLAGDLFQGIGTVVIGGDEGDMAKYFKTLERVIKLSPKVVFPSHGIGLGGVSIIEKTLEHRKMRENQIKEFHLQGLKPEEMLDKIYADVPQKLWPYAMENIQKHLIKLKAENLI